MPNDDSILDQATAWAVRAGDPAFDDWDTFTAWLAESPAHAEAYDRVAAAVAEAAELGAAVPVAANDEVRATPRFSRRWIAGTLAASLAVVLALGTWQLRGDNYTLETAPGEMRTVALSDGGKVELAGGTRLTLDHRDARFARLDSGQALFSIRHDAAHPFSLKVGDDTLVDAGTVFDVRRDAAGMSVAVSEGSVVFNPSGQGVALKPGDLLATRAGSAKYTLQRIPVDQVGEWRDGRITFRQASLAEIADQLARATGVAYAAAPGSAARTYSGSLVVTPLRNDPRALGPLLGVGVEQSGKAWVIEAQ